MMGSYTFHVYPGVYVIFNCESSTVTLDYEGTAVGSAQSLGIQITGAISNAQASNIDTRSSDGASTPWTYR